MGDQATIAVTAKAKLKNQSFDQQVQRQDILKIQKELKGVESRQ